MVPARLKYLVFIFSSCLSTIEGEQEKSEQETCSRVFHEYSDYLKGEAKTIGHKKPFHIKTKVLVLDEANKKKYRVRKSDFNSLEPIRVFIITDTIENQLTENVTTDSHGFTECYKKTKDGKSMIGPCAKWFNQATEKCKYGWVQMKYPGCCSPEKCECDCHYLCNSKEFGRKALEHSKKLNDFDNTKCTNNITSKEEGDKWRVKHCLENRLNQTKNSPEREQFLNTMKKCRDEENDEEYCLGRGQCYKNTKVCRYCYKWTCRKDARKIAKELCKDSKGEDKTICKMKKKSGNWLSPAFNKTNL